MKPHLRSIFPIFSIFHNFAQKSFDILDQDLKITLFSNYAIIKAFWGRFTLPFQTFQKQLAQLNNVFIICTHKITFLDVLTSLETTHVSQ